MMTRTQQFSFARTPSPPQVLPDAFMVTAPHQRPTSWRPAPGTAADAEHLARISSVYHRFKQQLAEQGLVPPLVL